MLVPFGVMSSTVQADEASERTAELRLLETTDLHGNIMPYDYYKNILFYTITLIFRCLFALQRNGLPPVTTHNIIDDWNDPTLNAIRRCNLFNTVQDRVKVYLLL